MKLQRMRNIFKILFLILMGISLVLPIKAQSGSDCTNLANKIGHGEILWTENAIMVQGTAAPNLSDPHKPVSAIKREAQRAATLDAFRKAAGILTGITVTNNMLAWDNPQVISRIQSYVPQPKICKTKFYSDGGVDIVIKVPLSGSLVNALLPDAGMDVAASKSKYTGLIVDASTLPFTPAIAPRLLGPDGTVLFSQTKAQKKVIIERGTVKYVSSKKMINPQDVGRKPLKTKALNLGLLSPSDLVLDRETAQILSKSPAFLGQGKVVIRISPVKKLTCQNLANTVKDRRIDWERKIVLARGFGKASFKGKESQAVRMRMMEMAAEVDAQRKLMEVFNNLVVNRNRSLKNYQESSKYLEGMIRNAVRCGAKYFKNGTAEVVLAAPIDGPASISADLGNQADTDTLVTASFKTTGLIIDAKGQKFKPIIAPELCSADGNVIYGSDGVSRAWALHSGIVGYASSINKAKADQRIGNNPLVIKAKIDPQHPDRLIIKSKDIKTLSRINQENGPLNQGRVIIVTENTIDSL